MTLLELAGSDAMSCERLMICVDRHVPKHNMDEVIRALGWVGFELATLDFWAGAAGCVSDRWLFLTLDT